MKKRNSRRFWSLLAGTTCCLAADLALAKPPTVAEALGLRPVQKDIEYDEPKDDALGKCTLKSETGKSRGFVVYDENQQVLRRFLDTDSDNSIDQWCYFKDGIEVYRDIDSDSNGKADQYRWLGTAGTRWGLDKDEDGKLDSWKQISAEEVTEEIVAAIRTKDVARFKRVLISSDELKTLDLTADRASELANVVSSAASSFADVAKKQKVIDSKSKWISFGGGKPGVVPAVSAGKPDIIVYDNVAAVVQTEGKDDKHAQVAIGTLVRIGDSWRAIDVPRSLDDPTAAPVAGFFFQAPLAKGAEETGIAGANISPELQKLATELSELDKQTTNTKDESKLRKLFLSKLETLEKIIAIADGEDADTWLQQYIMTISEASQVKAISDGGTRLKKLLNDLTQQSGKEGLACFLSFRMLQQDYQLQLKDAKVDDIPEIAQNWLEGLEDLVKKYGKSRYAAEPMLALAQEHEIHAKEKEAIKWYTKIVSDYPASEFATKAIGAKLRLESVGNRWMIQGPTIDGKGKVSASQLAGKTVLVQYWAAWADQSVADFETLKKLQAKYGKQGFQVVGVNLDTDKGDAQKALKSSPVSWPILWEPEGMDSRFANEMGLFTLPAMILIDKQGKVVSRNIAAGDLDAELKKLLK